jgi:hypothetical protein
VESGREERGDEEVGDEKRDLRQYWGRMVVFEESNDLW